MKNLVFNFLLISISPMAFAQNGTLEAINGVIVGDNTGVVTGTIRWTGTDFEGYDGNVWVSLTQSNTGGTISSVNAGLGLIGGGNSGTVILNANANNGLHVSFADDKIQLGGQLTESTTISQGAFDYKHNLNLHGDYIIQDSGVDKFAVLDNGRVVVGGLDNEGAFNVTGSSYFSDDLYLRDNSPNGNDLVRVYKSPFSTGIIDLYNSAGSVISRIAAIENSFITSSFGIGTTTPTQRLDVIGTGRFSALTGTGDRMVVASSTGVLETLPLPITADQKKMISAHDLHFEVGNNFPNGAVVKLNNYLYNLNHDKIGTVGLDLPEGTRIISVRAMMYDNSTTTRIEASLRRNLTLDGASTSIISNAGSVTTINSPTYNYYDVNFGPWTIGAGESYFIGFRCIGENSTFTDVWPGLDLRLVKFEVEYELP